MCSQSSYNFLSCSLSQHVNFLCRHFNTTSLDDHQTNSKVKRRQKRVKTASTSSVPFTHFYISSWSSRRWALWGQCLLLNYLCICVFSQTIPTSPTLPLNFSNIQNQSSEHEQLSYTTKVPQITLEGGLQHPIVAQFVNNPTRRTLSILFPMPTVVSQVVSTSSWNSSLSSSSPPSSPFNNGAHKMGRLSPPTFTSPTPDTRYLQTPEKGNVSRHTVLVPKTNLTTSDQVEVTTTYHLSSSSEDDKALDDGDTARTTVLEIIDRSPFILNLPISPHNSDIDPIVRRMFEKSTSGHLDPTTSATTRTTNTLSTDGTSGNAEDHLIRAGRQTHHDFIKRILNAVSVDSHNINRYVHLVKPKGGRLQGGDQVTDLGLPADIADEYIDGVNPPKFPGLKGFHPLIEKNDWRGPFKHTKPKKPGPLVTVVDPDRESPNLYSKLMGRQNQSSSNKPNKHFLPDITGPMQPMIKTESNQQQHKFKHQPFPRPPQRPPLETVSNTTTSQVEDNFSLNNRNVFKSKLSSVGQQSQSSRDSAKHDLSLLLKQEFDAKNAELNQTKAQAMSISPAGQVIASPPTRPGQKLNSHSLSSSQSDYEKLNKTTTSSQFTSANPLTGPPYQLPVELMNSSMATSGNTFNNAAMKEGVHYKTVSSLALPPELTSTTTSATTEKSLNSRSRTTKVPKYKNKQKEVNPVTDKNSFVRIRTGVRRPRPKSTTTTTTTESSLDDHDSSTPSSSSNSKLSSTPVTSPKFVTTISNDVRFQVESSNRPNFTQYSEQPTLLSPPSSPENDINELELNSDESRVQFNTSMGISDEANRQNSSSIVDDSVSIVPVTRQSTSYRLTTERLAYILIGTCCGLAVLVLIIVAMSVRCKDMCSEYRSWKNAEKAALRWHRHNRQRGDASGPYPMLGRSRFNLPRYFRTSIDNAKLRPTPMEPPFSNGNGLYADKALGNILHGSKAEGASGENSSRACCHCIDCSSTWFFRNDKHGGWCCQRGYYQPPRRTKLPFGAASSVNTFMPRMDPSDLIQTNNAHMQSGSECGAGTHEPILGRLHRNASEPNLGDMCFNDQNDNSHAHFGRMASGFDARLREKANSSGAIPIKVNMSSNPRFSDVLGGANQFSKCRLNQRPLFCEIDDYEDDDDEDDGDITTDFSNVFETNFGDEPSRPPRKTTKANHCNRTTGQSHSSALYSQKCPNLGPPMKTHKSDQTGSEHVNKLRNHPKRHKQHLPEYYNPSTGKYYFDSTSIAKVPLDAYRNGPVGNTNGESSTIWINSSKLVDKLHRKHQASRRNAADGHRSGHRGEGGDGHRRTAHHQHDRQGPSGGESSGDGQRNRRHRSHHRSSHQQSTSSGRGGQSCQTHFDPGLFARLGLPGKLTGMSANEHNFVVWNDTSERLI